ncbi:MAG: Asp23/Gls24 family envelope stress response protein [Clostridiales bacterium]|jgi:uncharacterized alkaline shock family protein YloU|nr:Asp23/Gls24 family envelope stress response protein [Clostridiales bacterium]
MALATSNIYGRITISDDAVAMVAAYAASECYGVAELISNRFSDIIADLFNKKKYGRGVKVITLDNRAFLSVNVILSRDINVDAVKESLRKAVIYHVEKFTGMRVKSVDINILGYKI